jgi:ribosomal protein S16
MSNPKTKTNQLKKLHDDRFTEIFDQTVKDMESLGTYKPEFSPAITRYAEMRMQFEIIMKQWYKSGCKVTEEYTNKAGATNERKSALYQAIESMRREITELENLFGLTPAGLKKIRTKELESKKKSLLAEALKSLE